MRSESSSASEWSEISSGQNEISSERRRSFVKLRGLSVRRRKRPGKWRELSAKWRKMSAVLSEPSVILSQPPSEQSESSSEQSESSSELSEPPTERGELSSVQSEPYSKQLSAEENEYETSVKRDRPLISEKPYTPPYNPGCCVYHRTFGTEARKCTGPCTWSSTRRQWSEPSMTLGKPRLEELYIWCYEPGWCYYHQNFGAEARNCADPCSWPRTGSEQSSSSVESGWCYYHQNFGAEARKCADPCTWSDQN